MPVMSVIRVLYGKAISPDTDANTQERNNKPVKYVESNLTQGELTIHPRIHTGKKQYVGDDLGKRFTK